MSYSDEVELEPTFEYRGTATVREGDEVYVRGIGDKLLGIGSFAGSLMLLEPGGTRVAHPIIEVQGTLIAGSKVDSWSPDAELIKKHRHAPTYPIADYVNEMRSTQESIQAAVDAALAAQMGVTLE
jgi:hypothetical protein